MSIAQVIEQCQSNLGEEIHTIARYIMGQLITCIAQWVASVVGPNLLHTLCFIFHLIMMLSMELRIHLLICGLERICIILAKKCLLA